MGRSVKLLAAGWSTGIRFPTRAGISLRCIVHTGDGTHPASCRRIRCCFVEDKETERQAGRSLKYNAEGTNSWSSTSIFRACLHDVGLGTGTPASLCSLTVLFN